ncbi:MAG: molybdopterin-dependent oxidoreductase [Chitinophagaceae bacterium]|nr:molybdopterin-dependent oxidoreductase [Chitinophagaceae bacterium]
MANQKNTASQRRSFIKTSVLAGGGLMLNFTWLSSLAETSADGPIPTSWVELGGFIRITPENIIKILNPNPDFGQNVMTSLPMIVAEELDADWKKVVVEMAPHSTKLGPQFSGGSNSVRMYWKPLREAGATARYMLMQAAAQAWGVDVSEITTNASMLYHKKSGRSATYGSFATKAASLPVPKNVKLKDVNDFKIVGNSQLNVEGKKIVTGTPLFGMDYKHEGMLIAMIEHPPAFGMKLKSYDATEALKMPGIKTVFDLTLYPDGLEQAGFDTRTFNELLVVVGKSTWEVMQARKKLKIVWTPEGDRKDTMGGRGGKTVVVVPGALETTSKQFEKMKERAMQPAKLLRKDGDPESAFKNAAQIIERTYTAPFLAHNCMEPINFFAHVTADKALLVGPLQAPGWAIPIVSKVLKMPADKIEVQMTRMGGGFGRRAYAHYLAEAALISQKANAPIKLVYTREDDMTYGIYRPMYTATYRAALDANKNLIGFHVKGGGIPEHPIHADRFPAGAIDNYLAEGWEIPTNITIGAYRAPRSNFNAAAEQSFLDELAEVMGKDPIDFRLELLKRAKEKPVGKNNDYDAARYAGVLELLKVKSGWGKPENKKYFRGVAAYFCHNSYAAHVIDIAKKNGEPYVERVTSAVDCGIVINPDAATNMVQGAVVDGIGNAFYSGLTHIDGAGQQANFNKYRIIRMHEAPKKIDVFFVDNDIDPTGLGEPPFPPVIPAVANALYKLEGKRRYMQPFGVKLLNS